MHFCHQATELSRELYAKFLEKLRHSYQSDKIKGKFGNRQCHQLLERLRFPDGIFGAMMNVTLTNEVCNID